MELTIRTRRVEHVVIIRLSGRFSVFDSTLRQTAFDLIAKGERHFLIDLSHAGKPRRLIRRRRRPGAAPQVYITEMLTFP